MNNYNTITPTLVVPTIKLYLGCGEKNVLYRKKSQGR
jgi:hypothetical protein